MPNVTSPTLWRITGNNTISPFSNEVKVGIGTDNPLYAQHTVSEFASENTANIIAAFDAYGDASRYTIRSAFGTVASPTQMLADRYIGTINFRGYHSGGAFATIGSAGLAALAKENFTATAQGSELQFSSTPIGSATIAIRLRIAPTGDIMIANSDANYTPTANSGKCLILTDNGATKPTLAADTAAIYAKNVAASLELFVEDEAGNETQISPHNFTKIPRSEPMAWSHFSSRDGQYITVDMLRALRILERLSGQKLVHSGNL